MKAIYRRELENYLNNPMGYVFIGIFVLLFSGIFCYANLYVASSDISYTFSVVIYLMLVLMPLLTMRSVAEEKAEKTDQLLFCSPVSAQAIVYGKFFAVMTLIGISLLFTLPHILLLVMQGNPQFLTTVLNYVGFLLYASVYAAIGIFISSLTESQVVSAVLSFAVFLALLFIEMFALPAIQSPVIYKIFSGISFAGRYRDFSLGILNLTSVVYYVSVAFLFNAFTVRVLEKHRA